MSDMGHSLVLAFDTDDPEFCRGVEVGRLWEQLNADPHEPVEQTLHASNAEMVLRMAEATDRPVTSTEVGDDWIEVAFGEKR